MAFPPIGKTFLDLLKKKAPQAQTTSPFGPMVPVSAPKVDGKDGVPAIAVGQQGTQGKGGGIPVVGGMLGGGGQATLPAGLGAQFALPSSPGGKAPGGLVPGATSVSMTGGPAMPLVGGMLGGGGAAPPAGLGAQFALPSTGKGPPLVGGMLAGGGPAMPGAGGGPGTVPAGPLVPQGEPAGEPVKPPEPGAGGVGGGPGGGMTPEEITKGGADAVKQIMDAFEAGKKAGKGTADFDAATIAGISGNAEKYAQAVYQILGQPITADSLKQLGTILQATLPSLQGEETAPGSGVFISNLVWDDAAQQFVPMNEEMGVSDKELKQAEALTPAFVARSQAIGALTLYMKEQVGFDFEAAMLGEQQNMQGFLLDKQNLQAIAVLGEETLQKKQQEIDSLNAQYQFQAGDEESKAAVKKGLLDIQKEFEKELNAARTAGDVQGQIDILREQDTLARALREELLIAPAGGGYIPTQEGQKFMSDIGKALNASSVENVTPLETALRAPLPPLPQGLTWDSTSGTFSERPGFEGRKIAETAEKWMAAMTPVFQARDRGETVLRQSLALRSELQAQTSARDRATADIRTALMSDQIDSAEEADVRRTQAETRLIEAKQKMVPMEMLMQLISNPVMLGLAKFYGVLPKIEETLGFTLPGVPTMGSAGVPLPEEWGRMTAIEQQMRLAAYVSETGQTPEAFYRNIQAQAPGQAFSTRVRTL